MSRPAPSARPLVRRPFRRILSLERLEARESPTDLGRLLAAGVCLDLMGTSLLFPDVAAPAAAGHIAGRTTADLEGERRGSPPDDAAAPASPPAAGSAAATGSHGPVEEGHARGWDEGSLFPAYPTAEALLAGPFGGSPTARPAQPRPTADGAADGRPGSGGGAADAASQADGPGATPPAGSDRPGGQDASPADGPDTSGGTGSPPAAPSAAVRPASGGQPGQAPVASVAAGTGTPPANRTAPAVAAGTAVTGSGTLGQRGGRPARLHTPLLAVGPDAGERPLVRVYDPATRRLQFSVLAYPGAFRGGVRVAVGDVTGDGISDLVTAPGRGGGSLIRVFDGRTGRPLAGPLGGFSAYPAGQADGAFVAAGDVDADGYADLVVGADGGTAPVRVFSGRTGGLLAAQPAGGAGGGSRVAAADLDGDGWAEVITGSGPGVPAQVTVYDGRTGVRVRAFLPFGPAYRGGVTVADGEGNADGRPDLFVGADAGPEVVVFRGTDTVPLTRFQPFGAGFTGGVRVTAADVNGDGAADLVAAPGPGGTQVRAFDVATARLLATLAAADGADGGLFAAGEAGTAAVSAALSSDPVVSVTAAAAETAEGDSEPGRFLLTRTGDLTRDLPVSITLGGTATRAQPHPDYTEAGTNWGVGGIYFAAGQAAVEVTVTAIDDGLFEEGLETVVLSIVAAPGALYGVGTPVAAVAIREGNSLPPFVPDDRTCGGGGDLVAVAAGVAGGGDLGTSAGGVRPVDGALKYTATDLAGDGWGYTRSWTADPGLNAGDRQGSGMAISQLPYLRQDVVGTVALTTNGSTARHFDAAADGAYLSRHYLQEQLGYDADTGQYTVTDTAGGRLVFAGFAEGVPAARQGQLQERIDPAGDRTTVGYDAGGRPAEVQQERTVEGTSVTESYLYAYRDAGANAGKVASVTVRRRPTGGGAWETVRRVEYDYYGEGDPNGNLGDLRTAVTQDAQGTVVDTQYYRYYTASDPNGFPGGLKYAFGAAAYARLAAVADPLAATDAEAAVYADTYIEYDDLRRVTKQVTQGSGCSTCSGGRGTSTYEYAVSAFADGYNLWRTRATETLPDGTQTTTFTNFAGQVLLTETAGAGGSSITYHRYDDSGRLVLTAAPSAVSGYNEGSPELLHNVGGNYEYLRDGDGLVTTRTYYTQTTAGEQTAGGVAGYLAEVAIQRGELGAAVAQQRLQYYAHTVTAAPPAGGSIGDRVWDDLDHDGVQDPGEPGLSGVTVNLLSEAGTLLASATTGGTGGYQFGNLAAGNYRLQVMAPSGYQLSPADQGGDDSLDSDVDPTTGRTVVLTLSAGQNRSDVDAGLYYGGSGGSGSIGDRVWEDVDGDGVQDPGESGRSGVTVNLLDSYGGWLASTTSGSTGGYQFGNLAAGSYRVQVLAPAGYQLSPPDQGYDDTLDSDIDPATGRTPVLTLSSGQNRTDIDAGLYYGGSGGGGSIGDRVWDDLDHDGIQDSGEYGRSGVTVNLLDSYGGWLNATTSAWDGSYAFSGLSGGSYRIEVVPPSGYQLSPQDQGYDDTLDSDVDPSTGRTGVLTLSSGQNRTDIDAGLYYGGSGGSGGSIGDRVWDDLDHDGIQDSGENGRSGVTVNLLDEYGGWLNSTTSGWDGSYAFSGLSGGSYRIEVVVPWGYQLSPQDQGNDDSLDSDIDPATGRTGVLTLSSGQNRTDVDAGLYYGGSGGSGGSGGWRAAAPQAALGALSAEADELTVYPVATETVFRNADGTGAQTTTSTYTWFPDSGQVQSQTVTRPAVSAAENGPGTPTSETAVFDRYGRVTWTRDAAGFLSYTEYDAASGAVLKAISDVDTTRSGDFADLPDGWTTPAGGGLHLISRYEVDNRGRVTKTTAPNGAVSYTVYNDDGREVRTYRGWDAATGRPTGPTEVFREDRGGGYTETLTMTATPTLDAQGRPTGQEAIGGLQSLSRSYTNTGGQVMHVDAYFELTGLSYSTSTTLGVEGVHYARSCYGYNRRGWQNRDVSPTGTVTRTVYDALGRVTAVWVGTDDTPTSGGWSPSNTAGTDLVPVVSYQYDGGGVGDGNLTQVTQYPGGGATDGRRSSPGVRATGLAGRRG